MTKHSPHLRLISGASVALLLLAAALPGAAQEDTAAEPAFEGTFRLAMSQQAATQRIHAQIEEAVEQVNFIIRGLARSRLQSTNVPYRTIRRSRAGDRVTVRYDDITYTTTLDQRETVTRGSEQLPLLQQLRGRHLYQTFTGDDGNKRMVHTLSEDGSSLWLDVTVTSSRLPEPLRYRLRYRRQ
jgi:hypothetical protein